jgi:hypothetical protein
METPIQVSYIANNINCKCPEGDYKWGILMPGIASVRVSPESLALEPSQLELQTLGLDQVEGSSSQVDYRIRAPVLSTVLKRQRKWQRTVAEIIVPQCLF